MFGFGAISELPLSTLSVTGVTHAGSAALNAVASTVNTPSLEVHLASSVSANATTAAAGELNKLGTTSLSASGTVAAAVELTKLGTASLSSSATIAAYPQPLAATATFSGSATVASSGGLTKLGIATLSASSTLAPVQELQVGAASLMADIGPLSGEMTGTMVAAGEISSSATVSSVPTRIIHVDTSADGSTSVSCSGAIEKLGQAKLGTGSPFTNGFTQGFSRGSFVTGHAFVFANHLDCKATIVADAQVTRNAICSLLATATFIADHPKLANLQSIGSLTGNSVLLHSGSISLDSIARIQARLSTDYDNPDIITLTLYIDKLRSTDGYISKSKNITSYIDKQFDVTSYIDKKSGTTGYIDKIVEKTLVRER